MIGAVKILAISEDTDVCNLIHSSLESEGQKAICVSSPLEALQLLHRGLVANFFLIHAAANKAKEIPGRLLRQCPHDTVQGPTGQGRPARGFGVCQVLAGRRPTGRHAGG